MGLPPGVPLRTGVRARERATKCTVMHSVYRAADVRPRATIYERAYTLYSRGNPSPGALPKHLPTGYPRVYTEGGQSEHGRLAG